MRTLCDVCESAAAVLFCAADEATLCRPCDDKASLLHQSLFSKLMPLIYHYNRVFFSFFRDNVVEIDSCLGGGVAEFGLRFQFCTRVAD